MDKTYIHDTAYGGYGVGKLSDGRVVFIPHTVEGDTVSFRVTEDKARFVYGEMIELLEPSELRGELYCPHIGSCGGCVFGHIDYEKQLQIKKRHVAQAFERNRIDIPEPDIISASFREFRNRATFRMRDGRIGFYKFKSNDFIPVDGCPVIKNSIVEKAAELASHSDGKPAALYITENEKGGALCRTDAVFTEKYGFAGLKTDKNIIGERRISFDTDYGTFYADFGSFLQGNRYLSGKLQEFVYEHAEGQRGLELYCGSGFLTLPFARKCGRVDAVESYPPAIRLAERTKLANVSWHVSPSERFAGGMRKRCDIILADPPRTGMDKTVCRFIRESGAARLLLISCDPNTLARDIGRLNGTYRVEKLCLADMFPGSYHVESLALLNKV